MLADPDLRKVSWGLPHKAFHLHGSDGESTLALAQCGPPQCPPMLFLVSSTDWVFTWLNTVFLTLRLHCLRTIMLREIKWSIWNSKIHQSRKWNGVHQTQDNVHLHELTKFQRHLLYIVLMHTIGVKYFFLHNRDTREDCRYTLHLIYSTFP